MKPSLFNLLALVLSAVLGLAAVARAEGIEVDTNVSDSAVALGQGVTFQIRVNGSDSPQRPDLGNLADFEAIFEGESPQSRSSVTIINGQVHREEFHGYIYQWTLRPRRAGALTIPAFKLTIEGKEYATKPLMIRVTPPREDPDVKLAISLDPPSPYVGEPAMLRVTLYLRRTAKDVEIATKGVEDLFNVPQQGFEQPGMGEQSLELLGDSVRAHPSRESIDGADYFVFYAERPIVARQPGEATLSATAACAVVTRQGDGFFDRGEARRASVPSNELKLTVRDLPAEGRPSNFNGLVGQFTVAATADPVNVNIGDPITLKVLVSGTGPMDRVPRPDFKRLLGGELKRDLAPGGAKPGFSSGGFRVPDDMAAPSLAKGQVTFVQTVRPLSPEVKQIPPIEIPYFDTKSGRYAVARSNPIPIAVAQTRVVTAGDAVAAGAGAVDAPTVEERKGGIAANIESPAVLADQRFDLVASLKSPMARAALAGPPALYFSAAVLVAVRRRGGANTSAKRARGALAAAGKHLERAEGAEAPAAISRAVRVYVADRFNLSAEGLTPVECEARLAPLDAAIAAEVRTVLDRCDAARFAGIPAGEVGQMRTRTGEVLQRLDALRARGKA